MDAKLFKCKCCGASLKPSHMVFGEYTCEYCGNRYRIENDNVIRVETFQNPVDVLTCAKMISQEAINIVGEEEATRITINQIAEYMVNSLIPYIQIEKEYDPMRMVHIIKGRVRVVKEDYRF